MKLRFKNEMKGCGGDAIAQMLSNEKVNIVFGIIDGTYMGLIASLKRHGIKLITPRHETSAAHMAGAYARLTGKLGVCIASNGPGVANILPGVAVEQAEGNRVLLITSCRRNPIIYPDRGGSYQCFDQTGVIGKMSKYSAAVPIPERLVEIMKQAFRMSFKGRPGLVHIDIPENYINDDFNHSLNSLPTPATYRRTKPVGILDEDVEEAANKLMNADFPVIHAGSGIIHAEAQHELEEVARLLHAPVTTSWAARGVTNEERELSIPMIYIDYNDKIRSASDLILCLGSRMGETDWWGKMPNWGNPANQKMIQVDLEDEFLGRHKPVDLAINGDVKVFLSKLAKQLHLMRPSSELGEKRLRKLRSFKGYKDKLRKKLDKHLEDSSDPMITAHLATICQKSFHEDAIAVFDGGNTAVWANFFHVCNGKNAILGTAKMGMLGAGVSQALGAAAAYPNRQVYCILGDGAMGFHMQEVETAIRNNLNVIYIVVCDKQWGMVKMSQQITFKPIKTVLKKSLDENETINADLGEIAFDKLGKSMGAHGERVSTAKEFEVALKQCIVKKMCCVIHVDVDAVKHLWAPSLLHFKKMHIEPKGK